MKLAKSTFQKFNTTKLKLAFVPLYFLFVSFVFANTTLAGEDLTLTCDSSDCVLTSTGAGSYMFQELDWWPGDNVSQTLTVINNRTETCNLVMDTLNETSTPAGVTDHFFTVIKRDATDLYGVRNGSNAAANNKTISNVFADGQISLGTLAASSSTNFEWVITFDENTGNEYQGSHTEFDFDLVFTCDGITSSSGPVDKTISDRDGDDNNTFHNSDQPSGEVAGSSTFTPSPFGVFIPLGDVAGESTESTAETPEEPVVDLPDIFGGAVESATDICTDPWWWWVLFVVQLVLHIAVNKFVKKEHSTKFKRYYLAQIIVGIVFAYIFWVYFCSWWDVVVAVLIAVLAIFLTRRKLKANTQGNGVSSKNRVTRR